MKDQQLYQQILGLTAPWSVANVDLQLDEDVVHVWLDQEPGTQCSAALPRHRFNLKSSRSSDHARPSTGGRDRYGTR